MLDGLSHPVPDLHLLDEAAEAVVFMAHFARVVIGIGSVPGDRDATRLVVVEMLDGRALHQAKLGHVRALREHLHRHGAGAERLPCRIQSSDDQRSVGIVDHHPAILVIV